MYGDKNNKATQRGNKQSSIKRRSVCRFQPVRAVIAWLPNTLSASKNAAIWYQNSNRTFWYWRERNNRPGFVLSGFGVKRSKPMPGTAWLSSWLPVGSPIGCARSVYQSGTDAGSLLASPMDFRKHHWFLASGFYKSVPMEIRKHHWFSASGFYQSVPMEIQTRSLFWLINTKKRDLVYLLNKSGLLFSLFN